MDADLTLVYFDFRGRAEVSRLMLHAAEIPFHDLRFPYSSWAEYKPDTPFGQVPYIIYKDKKYAQSLAIEAFLARKLGFYGDSDDDRLRIDEVANLCGDVREPIRDMRKEFNPEKRAILTEKLKNEHFPRFLRYFEDLLIDNNSTGFFVGDSLTLADFKLYDMIDIVNSVYKTPFTGYPCLEKLRDNVEKMATVKTYLDSRPKTDL